MIRADLYTLFRLKWIKLCTVFMLLVVFGMVLLQKTAMAYTVKIDRVLFLPMVMYGIAVAILISMTTGSDYDGAFIRNKLFAGNRRSRIYLSKEIANLVGGIGLYIATVMFTILISFGLFERNATPIKVLAFFLLGLFTCLVYIAIFSMVSLLSGNKATSGVVCLVLAFVLLFLSLYSHSILSQQGTESVLHEFLYDLNPTGQIAQISSMQCLNPTRYILLDCLLVLATNGVGLFFFSKKEFS